MPRRPPARRVTQKAIAERLGIRQATVSRVLAGSELIAAETTQRVLAVAAELGYRPNLAARGIRGNGAYGAVAYAISTHRSYNIFDPALVQTVEAALREAGQHCVLTSIDHQRLDDAGYVGALLGSVLADALLLAWVGELAAPARATLKRMHVPAVQINAPGPEDCVRFADRPAAAEAARQFLARGHRRIAYLDCSISTGLSETYYHYSNRDRWDGFATALREAGIEARRLTWPFHPEESTRVSQLRQLLAQPDRPTAVLCYGYESDVLPLILAARDLGLSVPADLSVCTFAARGPAVASPPLAHLLLDHAGLGRAAVAMALARTARSQGSLPSVELPMPMVEGATLAPPPQGAR